MIFDDLSLRMQIILGLTVPPLLTLICWFASRRLARGEHPESKLGLSAMLLAAYLFFALALYGSRYFAGTERGVDPSAQVLR
jgi:hypothetical protein